MLLPVEVDKKLENPLLLMFMNIEVTVQWIPIISFWFVIATWLLHYNLRLYGVYPHTVGLTIIPVFCIILRTNNKYSMFLAILHFD